jgi:hypothetical protein
MLGSARVCSCVYVFAFQWELSSTRLTEELAAAPADCHIVATGFIASTTDGVMTTLRRDGRCVVRTSAVVLRRCYDGAFHACMLFIYTWL